MKLNLENKRALISSSAIGAEIAKTLAREGAIVAIHGRNAERAERITNEIKNDGGQAFVAIGDLSNNESARNVADTARKLMGGVDILINNAGGADDEPITWKIGAMDDYG